MTQNVGKADSIVRIAFGALAGIVSLGILGGLVPAPVLLSPILGVVAIALVATGITGFCGLYSLVGIDTCQAR